MAQFGLNGAKLGIAAIVAGFLTACSAGDLEFSLPDFSSSAPTTAKTTASAPTPEISAVIRSSSKEKECLLRAMYFESNRSSEEGMLAVGTVVMNRVADSRFPNTVCGVVTQPRQFAPGVMTRALTEKKPVALASKTADRVLRGARHPGVRNAKFFHQAGLRFPYNNMNYVLEAGGNEFYIKGNG